LNSLKSIKNEKIQKFHIIRNHKHELKEKIQMEIQNESGANNTTFSLNSLTRENQQNEIIKNIQEIDYPLLNIKDSVNKEYLNIKVPLNNKKNIDIHNLENPIPLLNENSNFNKHFNQSLNLENFQKMNDVVHYMNLMHAIQNLTSMVNVCFENLKFNQNLINLVMTYINKGN